MADCCSAPGLMPLDNALARLMSAVIPVQKIIEIEIEDSDGYVIAHNVTSSINVPTSNNSAMDGYAICADELESQEKTSQSVFQQIGKSFAGQPFNGSLKNGECIRIMTGAVVPENANAVVMQENTQVNGEQIQITQPHKKNENIRFAGEDIQQNQIIFKPHHKLRSVDIGLLASLGVAKVAVYRRLKVAVFSTGDELKRANESLNTGDIYDSNRHTIKAMLRRMNIDVVDFGIIKDNLNDIRQAFIEADKVADAVISSGGVSVGEADYTKDVLDEIGQIGFWKVAMKPGKPFAFGTLPNSVFFGLPGNPVSATVTFHVLAAPTLNKMQGCAQIPQMDINAVTLANIKKRAGRMDFQRGIASTNQLGQLEVLPLSAQGSGILSSMSNANCYIVLAQEDGSVTKGEMVKVRFFDQVLS